MGFVLRVTRGAGEGESFTFEQEARLGRTADNDVVIKDPSSSRSHARVFTKGGRFFVEDLNSANGTQLNDAMLSTPKALKPGDEITIGDVVLEFTELPEDSAGASPSDTMVGASAPSSTVDDSSLEPEDRDPYGTQVKTPAPLVRRPPPKRARPARAPEPEEEEEEIEEPAASDEAEVPEDEGDEPEEGPSTKHFDVPPPRALARSRGDSAVRAARGSDDGEMTAAERARLRREMQKSASGRAQLMWEGLSKPGRIATVLVLSLLGVGGLGGLAYVMFPKQLKPRPEPMELRANADPLAESFGLGDDVAFKRPDQKSFTFTYASPTRVVGILHYQSRNISKGEVTIELNGTEIGTVVSDTLDSDTREHDLLLPSASVKVGVPNTLVFDNVKNPPAEDTWRVSNIWVELSPIPEMSGEEATRRAKEDIEKAAKFYDLKGVGGENLFRAWKTYRDAWLVLEATPDRPDSLFQLASTRVSEIRKELDSLCAQKVVEFKKVMNLKVPDIVKARKILEDIPNSFPTREHPCNSWAHHTVSTLEELPDEIEVK